MSEPTQNLDVVMQGLGRLTSMYAKQPSVVAILTALLTPKQELENVLWDVFIARRLSTATLYALPGTNSVLDSIGALIEQPRDGMSDADYQAVIYLVASVRRTSGRVTDWSNFASILLARLAGGPAQYTEGNAAFDFGVFGFEPNTEGASVVQAVAGALARAVPNGIRATFLYSTWPDGNDLEWCDVANPSTTGQGTWGDSVAGLVGGLLVSAQGIG